MKINKLLKVFGYVLVPVVSGKMLNEYANVGETHHPSKGGRTVDWMRQVAKEMPYRKE